MQLNFQTILLPLFALFMVSMNVSADDVAQAALRYAEKNRTLAVESVTKAERHTKVTEAELRIARDIERDALRLGDRAALAVARDAIAEGELGLKEANLLLARAQSLLAQRERTQESLRARLRTGAARGGVVVTDGGDVQRYTADGATVNDPTGPLRAGETVRTGRDGSARLFLSEGRGQAQLAAESEFTVTEDDGLHDFIGELKQGMVRLLAHLSKKERFEVRTPSAVCAVRGTDFAVENSGEQTRVRVFSGVVAVTSIANGKTIEVTSGHQWTSGEQGLEPFDTNSYPAPWGSGHAAHQ
jgi:ferric-dicitrate binding protein FerR (iron transport regulator)